MKEKNQIDEMAKIIDEYTDPLSARDIHKADFAENLALKLYESGTRSFEASVDQIFEKIYEIIHQCSYQEIFEFPKVSRRRFDGDKMAERLFDLKKELIHGLDHTEPYEDITKKYLWKQVWTCGYNDLSPRLIIGTAMCVGIHENFDFILRTEADRQGVIFDTIINNTPKNHIFLKKADLIRFLYDEYAPAIEGLNGDTLLVRNYCNRRFVVDCAAKTGNVYNGEDSYKYLTAPDQAPLIKRGAEAAGIIVVENNQISDLADVLAKNMGIN